VIRSLVAFALLAGPACQSSAHAFPDGAPWNAVRDPGCADCHFDGEVHPAAGAVNIEGLPETVAPGGVYRLRITFDGGDADSRYGMLLSFLANGAEAGQFVSSGDGVEIKGAQVRSVTGLEDRPPRWDAVWQAPETLPAEGVRVLLWANAGNGDGSPFGDRVYRLDRTLRAAGEK